MNIKLTTYPCDQDHFSFVPHPLSFLVDPVVTVLVIREKVFVIREKVVHV